ncbi:DUF4411 family protein [Bacillus cereus]|uniref:DUF4411 family protein n=1 Tax=Bacillus cereus TaxID=1396 RepID=UPI000BED64C3|nr:DUF4411 family protein [Bacillus cereus]PEA01906.1 hypothetical protein CON37_25335 [Bacillus cereus]
MDEVQNIKTYFTDTNCYRYPSAITNKSSSPQMVAKKKHKATAKKFWDNVAVEASLGKAVVMTCKEVTQELKVQSYTLEPKENRIINNLISQSNIQSIEIPTGLEYSLREFSNYARSKYGNILTPPGYSMQYLKTSDARIFVNSYVNEAILVTANIRDFLLYPLFFGDDEDVLYDILNETYVKLPEAGRKAVEQDIFFKNLLKQMKELEE